MTLHDQCTPESIAFAVRHATLALESSNVPRHLQPGLLFYFETGILPGGFLQAVLCNDLREALGRADVFALLRLMDIVGFLYDYAPALAWGSREKVLAWTTTPDRLEV